MSGQAVAQMARYILAIASMYLFGVGVIYAYADDSRYDVELVLLSDVSGSMDAGERKLQREAYVAAFLSDDVWHAVERGYRGRILLSYVEFADATQRYVLFQHEPIRDRSDLQRVAAIVAESPPNEGGQTAIGQALIFAASLMTGQGDRQVIDVSGDGKNNNGIAPEDVPLDGIQVNAIPVVSGYRGAWELDSDALEAYYRDKVSRHGFTMPTASHQEFARSLRQKLVLEIGWLR